MNYGHVGRPTNEEVAIKKRKKMIKILAPVAIIAIIAIVLTTGGFSGLMGNSVLNTEICKYVCDDSNYKVQGDKCIYETTKMSEPTKAYLLGDADYDGKITNKDLATIIKLIESGSQLDSIQKAVYDLNGDKKVDALDVEYINSLSTSAVSSLSTSGTNSPSTSGINYSSAAYNMKIMKEEKYVCPYDDEKVLTENGIKTTKTRTYTLITNGDYKKRENTYSCSNIVKILQMKDAKCYKANTVQKSTTTTTKKTTTTKAQDKTTVKYIVGSAIYFLKSDKSDFVVTYLNGDEYKITINVPKEYDFWYVGKVTNGKEYYWCQEKYEDLNGNNTKDKKWKEKKCDTYKYKSGKHKGEQQYIFVKYRKGSIFNLSYLDGEYFNMHPAK